MLFHHEIKRVSWRPLVRSLAFFLLTLWPPPALADQPTPILSFSPPGYVTHLVTLASPGDVNGDGKPDLLLGVMTDGSDGLSPGRGLLYLGGAPFDTIPDLVLPVIGLFFGCVSHQSDLNGDGWQDIVLAGGGAFRGEVSIFFGGPHVDVAADLVIESGSSNLNKFGGTLECMDLNGDGFQDLIVGWPQHFSTDAGIIHGKVLVYYGGPLLDSLPDAVLQDPPTAEFGFGFFGEFVHSAGDFDGDGWEDLGIYQRELGSVPGQVFIYRGGPAFDSNPVALLPVSILTLPYPRVWAFAPLRGREQTPSRSVVTMGHEVVIDGNSTSWGFGLLWLYEGIGSGVSQWPPDQIFESSAGSLFGPLWADADLTGDGWRDLVIGGGRLLIYSTSRLDLPADLELRGPTPANRFGYGITAVDINGDGVTELLVTEPGPEAYPVWGRGRVHAFDLSQSLAARAFVLGTSRVVPLSNASSIVNVQFEPIDGGYSNTDVDMSSLRLRSEGSGDVETISGSGGKTVFEADTDHNGVAELQARFATSELSRLFSTISGRRELPVSLEGKLRSGRVFRASFTMAVLGVGKPEHAVSATVSPTPMNPNATLTLELAEAGLVTVSLYDVSGRLVRSLLRAASLPAGVHRVGIDGRDDHGRQLSSGIYFYSVRSPAGTAMGRVIVAK